MISPCLMLNHPPCDAPPPYRLKSGRASLLAAQMRDSTLCLGGLPALQRCRHAFRADGDGSRPLVHISDASFDSQRSSLQELTLRGVSSNIQLASLGWYLIGLPALRCLAIQNLGVTNLWWLETTWHSAPACPLHRLNLDDNAALQLDGDSAAALLNMTGLKKLSMRQKCCSRRCERRRRPDWTLRGRRWCGQLTASAA